MRMAPPEGSFGMTDFSIPGLRVERKTSNAVENKESKETREKKSPYQELYLRRVIERFGIIPESSPIHQEAQKAIDILRPYIHADVRRVFVINSGEINAMVFLHGDTVFFHRGLLKYLLNSSREEGYEFTLEIIAGVAGHEAGHLEQDTGEDQSPKEEDDEKKDKKENSKELEYDADKRAVLLLESAGLNPLEFTKTLKALVQLSDQSNYSSSHPRSYQRMTDIEAILGSPETVASITRKPTAVSPEFIQSLDNDAEYPHVDDQIFELSSPDDIPRLMANFDNPADQMEWMQHYITYEQYRIAREQMETAECRRDLLHMSFISNITSVLKEYLEIDFETRTEAEKNTPAAVENEVLFGKFFQRYGEQDEHRREGVAFISKSQARWDENKATLSRESREVEEVQDIDLEVDKTNIRKQRDTHFYPVDFKTQVYGKFLDILSEVQEILERKILPQYTKKVEEQQRLFAKRDKLIKLFNYILNNLPDFSDPNFSVDSANWQATLNKTDVDGMVDDNEAFLKYCTSGLGAYTDRFIQRLADKEEGRVTSSQKFKGTETILDILEVDGQTPDDRKKIFEFLCLRHALGSTFSHADKSTDRTYDGGTYQYNQIFSSAEKAYPLFHTLCDVAGHPLNVDDENDDFFFDEFLPVYLSLQEGRDFLPNDIRLKAVVERRAQYFCDLSLEETRKAAAVALAKYDWVAESSIGPEIQLEFPKLSGKVREIGNIRTAHTQLIFDSYRGKLRALLNWHKKIQEVGSDEAKVLAESSLKGHDIRYWEKTYQLGFVEKVWGKSQVESDAHFDEMITEEAIFADNFFHFAVESYPKSLVSSESLRDLFVLLADVKAQSGQVFSVEKFIKSFQEYPYLNLQSTLPLLIEKGLLPCESSVLDQVCEVLNQDEREKLLKYIAKEIDTYPFPIQKFFRDYIIKNSTPELLKSFRFDYEYVEKEKESSEYKQIPTDDRQAKLEYFLDKYLPLWSPLKKDFPPFYRSPALTIMRLFCEEKQVMSEPVDAFSTPKQTSEIDIPNEVPWDSILACVRKYKDAYIEKYGEECREAFDILLSELGMLVTLDNCFKSTRMIPEEGNSLPTPTISDWLKEVFEKKQGNFHSFILNVQYRSQTSPDRLELVNELANGINPQEIAKFIDYSFLDLFDYFIKAGMRPEAIIDQVLENIPPSQTRDQVIAKMLEEIPLTKEIALKLIERGLASLPEGRELQKLDYSSLVYSKGKLRTESNQAVIGNYGKHKKDIEYTQRREQDFGTTIKSSMIRSERTLFHEPSPMAEIYYQFVDGKFTTNDPQESLKLQLLEKFIFTDEFFNTDPLEIIMKLVKIQELIPEETTYKDYLIEKLEEKARKTLKLDAESQVVPWYFKYASKEEVNPDQWLGPTPASFLYNFYRHALPHTHSSEKRIRMGRTAFEIWKYQMNEGKTSFEKELEMIQELFPEFSVARDQYLSDLLEKTTHPEQVEKVKTLILSIQTLSPDQKVAKTNGNIEKLEEGLGFMDRTERKHLFFWLIGHPQYKLPPDTIRYLGVKNDCTFDTLPKYFGALTFEEQKKFLRNIFRAENGILDESLSTDQAQIQESEQILNETIEEMFIYLFPQDQVEEKYRGVYNTIFSTLMHELNPERRTQLVFAILKSFQEGNKPTVDDIMGSILNIGVVFKKSAQILSERKDLLPASLCESLSRIKDDAEPISKAAVMEVFRRDGVLGNLKSVGELLGTASVGQVHRVTDTEGKSMVGKIKSPVVDKYREDDIVIVSSIIGKLESKHGLKVPDFADEIRHLLNEESEFTNELTNRNLLAPVFEEVNTLPLEVGGKFKTIDLVLPEITEARNAVLLEQEARGYSLNDLYYLSLYDRVTQTKDISVSEKTLERGKKVRDRMAKERKLGLYRDAIKSMDEIHLRLVDLVVAEVFEHGVFHADKHRGNIMLNLDESGENATITAIDFGNVVHISREEQNALKALFQGLALGMMPQLQEGIKGFVGRDLPDEAMQKVSDMLSSDSELKDKMERLSLIVRDHFVYEERTKFVNILKGFVSSFYIFEDMSEDNKQVAMTKVVSKFFE